MKAADIVVGCEYFVKNQGTLIPVLVTGTFEYIVPTRTKKAHGWLISSYVLGESIQVKSPQRFVSKVNS